jgi:hypothetical protein
MKKKKCMMKWAGLIPLALQVTPCTSAKAGVMWGSVRKCRLMTLKEIVMFPLFYRRFLFPLRRRLSISFACRSSWISASCKAILYRRMLCPFLKYFIALIINSGELLL